MAVHNSFASFERALEKRAAEVREQAEERLRSTIVEASDALIEATPVSSGRMASNWGVVDAGEEPDYDASLRKEDIPDASISNELEAHTKRLGDVVDIATAVPYARHVDDREDILGQGEAAAVAAARRNE